MSGRVHQLTASTTGGPLAEPTLLDLCRALWLSQDFAGIQLAAVELIANLFPGTRARLDGPDEGGTDERALQLRLQNGRHLVLRPAAGLPDDDDLLQAAVRLIDLRLGALAQHQELTASVLRLEEAERLQRALYAIADQASANQDVNQTLRALHRIVADLMYAENFYIVLYDSQRDTIRFAYFADVADPDPPDPHFDQPMDEIRYGPTWYLIRKGEPLMGGLGDIAK